MIITVCAFTEKGYNTFNKIEEALPEHIFKLRQEIVPLGVWAKDAFTKHMPVVFIGAAGIAVRTIAPFVEDKLTDSPVIVIDEKGEFVIPILSGHIGAANDIAKMLAKAIGATAVLTTATDVESIFAVDVFARKNYFSIENREGIKKVSSKLLRGEKASIWLPASVDIQNKNIPNNIELVSSPEFADIKLIPKKYTLGIGCKKGKTFEELKEFVDNCLKQNNIDINEVTAITSIDLKAKEEGLNTLAGYYHVPFITYSSFNLEKQEGCFSESSFVKEITGVSNVCERAAVCFENGGELLVKKTAFNGMTFAVAKHEGRITTWET